MINIFALDGKKGEKNMLVAFQDELGVVVVKVSKPIIFGANVVYFTDDSDRDYTVKMEHLINIVIAE